MEENKPKKHWGRGRRKPKELANRTKRFEIRLTVGEWNQLHNEAEQNGHSPTRYARLRLFKKSEAAIINPIEFLRLYRERSIELKKIGNNINQLARYVNYIEKTEQVNPALMEELSKHLQDFIRCQRETADLSRKILKA